MRTPDLTLTPVVFNNPIESQQFGAFTARLTEILRDIADLHRVKIVTVAPTEKTLEAFFDTSEVIIYHATLSSNRKVYYKIGGVVYSVNSS